jgi:hypothetical protein
MSCRNTWIASFYWTRLVVKHCAVRSTVVYQNACANFFGESLADAFSAPIRGIAAMHGLGLNSWPWVSSEASYMLSLSEATASTKVEKVFRYSILGFWRVSPQTRNSTGLEMVHLN